MTKDWNAMEGKPTEEAMSPILLRHVTNHIWWRSYTLLAWTEIQYFSIRFTRTTRVKCLVLNTSSLQCLTLFSTHLETGCSEVKFSHVSSSTTFQIKAHLRNFCNSNVPHDCPKAQVVYTILKHQKGGVEGEWGWGNFVSAITAHFWDVQTDWGLWCPMLRKSRSPTLPLHLSGNITGMLRQRGMNCSSQV